MMNLTMAQKGRKFKRYGMLLFKRLPLLSLFISDCLKGDFVLLGILSYAVNYCRGGDSGVEEGLG